MSLVKCKECGQQVSSQAEACPHCGAKRPKTSGCTAVIAVFFAIVMVSAMINGTGSSTSSSTTPVSTQQKIVDDGKQASRKQLMESSIQHGIFLKITYDSELPHVWVTPLWHALNIDQKQQITGVVHDYFLIDSGGTADIVAIYDGTTGKHIGRYSASGLHLD